MSGDLSSLAQQRIAAPNWYEERSQQSCVSYLGAHTQTKVITVRSTDVCHSRRGCKVSYSCVLDNACKANSLLADHMMSLSLGAVTQVQKQVPLQQD